MQHAPQIWAAGSTQMWSRYDHRHTPEEDDYSMDSRDVYTDSQAHAGPEHSARTSEIDRSLADTTMRSSESSTMASTYSMDSGSLSSGSMHI
jgi:hypothetical protein